MPMFPLLPLVGILGQYAIKPFENIDRSFAFAKAVLSLKGRWIDLGDKLYISLPSGVGMVYKQSPASSNCSWGVWMNKDWNASYVKYDDDKNFILDEETAKQRVLTALAGKQKQ